MRTWANEILMERLHESVSKCHRCGLPFNPRWMKWLSSWARCCTTCAIRNLHDSLGLPTPPELIDKHTKRPCLSEREYRMKLRPRKKAKAP